MKLSVRSVGMFCAVLLGGYTSWRTYYYFFDVTLPVCNLLEIDEGKYYKGDINCVLTGHDTYSIAHVSIWLDGKSLIDRFAIGASSFEYPFTIPTRTLTNGAHEIKIEVADGTYHQNIYTKQVPFMVDNIPLQSAFVKKTTDYKVFQGRTIHLQFQTNKEIHSAKAHALAGSFDCFQESQKSCVYEAFIPVACEEVPNEYVLTIDIRDHVGNMVTLDKKFQVVMYPFKKGNLQLDPETVKQEKDMGISQDLLEEDIITLAAKSPHQKLWQGSFVAPIEIQRVTTDFGVIRTTQERGRYMHKAVDVINAPKSVVWAPQEGVVVMKDRYAFSGNTVVLDHGFGIFSLLYHLDEFADISLGDRIKQGAPVGTLGKTGYAKGYHLHWEMRVCNIAIDPLQWLKPDF